MWFAGHQSHIERPWCQQRNGTWTKSETARLQTIDDLNADLAGSKVIDRHGCAHLDINRDGLEDVFCSVGAGKGHGMSR